MRSLLLLAVLLLNPYLAASQQLVAGLRIPYEHAFRPMPLKALEWKNRLPEAAKSQISAYEVFESSPTSRIAEARVLRLQFVPGVPFSIDGAADGAFQSLLALPGIQSPSHRVVRTIVSGQPARRLSFEASRYGGLIGGEFLQVFDSASNTTWQLQLIFVRERGFNPFADLSLAEQRAFAARVLDSVELARK